MKTKVSSGVVEHMDFIIRDGHARKFLHEHVVQKWDALWKAHDMSGTTKLINSGAYPHEPRDAVGVGKAVENFLRFSTDIRKEHVAYMRMMPQLCRHDSCCRDL